MSGGEHGQATVFIIGLAVVLLMAVAVVVDASAAFLQRQELDTVADGAALAGADAGSRNLEALYGEGVAAAGRLDQAEAAARPPVVDHLQRTGAQQLPRPHGGGPVRPGGRRRHRHGPRTAGPSAHAARFPGRHDGRRGRFGRGGDRARRLTRWVRRPEDRRRCPGLTPRGEKCLVASSTRGAAIASWPPNFS